MKVSLRPTLAILALTTLGLSMGASGGFYQPGTMFGVLVALACSLVACLAGDRELPRPAVGGNGLVVVAALFLAAYGLLLVCLKLRAQTAIAVCAVMPLVALAVGRGWLGAASAGEGPLAACTLALAGNALFWDNVSYCDRRDYQELIYAAGWLGLAAVLALLVRGRSPTIRGWKLGALVGVLFAAGALVRLGAVWASPDPVIDVYAWLREAPAHLLHGRNPYAADYTSPYETERANRYDVSETPDPRPAAYPPLPILAALPFAAAGLDVRYANVACDLAAALVLFLTGSLSGRPRVGALVCAAYLLLPRAPYMIEQAWFEPMLAAALGWGMLLVYRGRRAGYFLLGLGLTGKQFGLSLFPPLSKNQWGRWPWLLLGLVAAAAVVILPFFLWDPDSFLSVVLFKHLRRGPVWTSMTVASAVFCLSGGDPYTGEGGYELPRAVTWLAAVVLIALLTWRTPRDRASGPLWMGTALLVFCLFHTQGHFNYYYLCQYLWLLGIAGLLTEGEEAPPAGVEVPAPA